jgi:hypothetical protein
MMEEEVKDVAGCIHWEFRMKHGFDVVDEVTSQVKRAS